MKLKEMINYKLLRCLQDFGIDSKYTDNKELVIIPNATHCDLYDQKDKIPFDKIETFLKENLK